MTQAEITKAIAEIYAANCEIGPSGGGGMFPNEYAFAVQTIIENPGNILVFGLGNDSWLWAKLNKPEPVCFVEDDPRWIDASLRKIDDKLERDTQHVWLKKTAYCPKPFRQELVQVFKTHGVPPLHLELAASLIKHQWSVIIVDAPTGERVESLYLAHMLALMSPSCAVLVHDYTRDQDSVELAFNNHPVHARAGQLVLFRHTVGELRSAKWARNQLFGGR